MRGLLISIGLIVAVWLVGLAAGFRVSLVYSLVMTIGLTLILNMIMGGVRHRRDVRRFEL